MALWCFLGILFAFGCIDLSVAQSGTITVTPSDLTAGIGHEAIFTCQVQGLSGSNSVIWMEHITSPTGLKLWDSQYGWFKPEYEQTYEITGPTGTDLKIKSVTIIDGGLYSCGLALDANTHRGDLVVLDQPKLQMPPLVQGKTHQVSCTAQYGGPQPIEQEPEHTPHMKIFADGVEVVSSEEELTPGRPGPPGSYLPSSIRRYANYTANSLDNDVVVVCKVQTESPAYVIEEAVDIDVLYEPKDMSIYPRKEVYQVGEHINCTAGGNPFPDFKWTPIRSNGAREYSSQTLEILETMVEENVWKCRATNFVDDIMYIEEEISFYVTEPEVPNAASTPSKYCLSCLLVICIANLYRVLDNL